MTKSNQKAKISTSVKSQETEQAKSRIVKIKQCKSCNNAVHEHDDICENCSSWLLEDQCCFCYNAIKPDQKFCGHCGNSPKGIPCVQCNQISHFDFCRHCDIPVSKTAQHAVSDLKSSPEIQELQTIVRQQMEANQSSVQHSKSTEHVDHLQSMLDELIQYTETDIEGSEHVTEHTSTASPKSGFSFGSSNKDFSEVLHQSNKAVEDREDKKNKEDKDKLLKDKIREIQDKTFSNNQAARQYYTALKITLPEFKPCSEFLGWLCNFANFIHYDGPSGCAGPGHGGRWVCKDDVQQISPTERVFEGVTYVDTYNTGSV